MGIVPEVEELAQALLALDRRAARRVLEGAFSLSGSVTAIEGIVEPAMELIGDEWERGRVALSQVYMSGRICEKLVEALVMTDEHRHRTGEPRTALCVLIDSHALGKQLVKLTLRSAGYRPEDLGARLTVEHAVAACVEKDIDVLMVSVLMLPSALAVAELHEELAAARSGTALVVGGAPFRFDERLWREVGADHFGRNASDALRILARMRRAA